MTTINTTSYWYLEDPAYILRMLIICLIKLWALKYQGNLEAFCVLDPKDVLYWYVGCILHWFYDI